jgi:hypothetical protein
MIRPPTISRIKDFIEFVLEGYKIYSSKYTTPNFATDSLAPILKNLKIKVNLSVDYQLSLETRQWSFNGLAEVSHQLTNFVKIPNFPMTNSHKKFGVLVTGRRFK